MSEQLNEEQILKRLLEMDTLPEKTVTLARLGIPIKLRGLTGKQVYNLRERCTERKTHRNQVIDRLDEEQFNIALIATATVSPNWGDSRLLAKYQASGGEEVIKRLLLAGELSALGDEVLDLSGFNTTLDEVKKLIRSGGLAGMLYAMWVDHHMRPGEYWSLPRGEQLFLTACYELEVKARQQAVRGKQRG